MNKNAKILIIRLSALGDTIHTLPLAVSIKNAYPDSKIGWIVEDKAKQFIQNNPVIDKCFVIPKKKWQKRGFSLKNFIEFWVIIRKIRRENYDIVLDTQQLFKSSVIMAFLNIKRKITLDNGREFSWLFANEIIKTGRKQFDKSYHVVRRNLEFAKYLGIKDENINFVLPKINKQSADKVDELLRNLDSNKKTIVLAPATTWENKHWKNKYWSRVLDELSAKNNIIITGSSADSELCDLIIGQNKAQNVINLCGMTNLLELSEVFRRSDIVISPDSGSAHIAWAVQKPIVITIFCATSHLRTGPFGEKNISTGAELACSPCMKRKCRMKEEKNKCTYSILPEKIINIVNDVLQ